MTTVKVNDVRGDVVVRYVVRRNGVEYWFNSYHSARKYEEKT